MPTAWFGVCAVLARNVCTPTGGVNLGAHET